MLIGVAQPRKLPMLVHGVMLHFAKQPSENRSVWLAPASPYTMRSQLSNASMLAEPVVVPVAVCYIWHRRMGVVVALYRSDIQLTILVDSKSLTDKMRQ